jgi:hypothetical protein
MNPRSAKILHGLGIELVCKHFGYTRIGQKVKNTAFGPAMVHVQNTMGLTATIWINGTDNFIKNLKENVHLFVCYDRSSVSVYLGTDCSNPDNYAMDYVSKGAAIALKYKFESLIKVGEVTEPDIVAEFCEHSSAKEFNLNSPHYTK